MSVAAVAPLRYRLVAPGGKELEVSPVLFDAIEFFRQTARSGEVVLEMKAGNIAGAQVQFRVRGQTP